MCTMIRCTEHIDSIPIDQWGINYIKLNNTFLSQHMFDEMTESNNHSKLINLFLYTSNNTHHWCQSRIIRLIFHFHSLNHPMSLRSFLISWFSLLFSPFALTPTNHLDTSQYFCIINYIYPYESSTSS